MTIPPTLLPALPLLLILAVMALSALYVDRQERR